MKSRIIICGKSASGKDYFRKILEGRGFRYAVSYTSRPPRKDEMDGKDYFFIEECEFQDMIDREVFYEYTNFNGWFYGTTKEQWKEISDVFILTPSGISSMQVTERKSSFIIYLDIPLDVRIERLKMRSDDNDSIQRRIERDEIDFQNFQDYDIKITNNNF